MIFFQTIFMNFGLLNFYYKKGIISLIFLYFHNIFLYICEIIMKEKERVKLHFSFCHRKPERSFFWRGKQFPVCARCTGIHLGYLSFPFFLFGVVSLNFWMTILLIVPTYLDGFIQAYYNKESTNMRRLITGLMAGVGTMSLVSITGIFIAELILKFV